MWKYVLCDVVEAARDNRNPSGVKTDSYHIMIS